ncbi:3-deoxy-manno-octulosonate cytidylyltransferase [Daejeonella lutea]|uniref:3-deoxy-manno-octulosonate cytidylyltransferase n=1 Tax=Daejeonella lutea TaxID=572036 RepID=A0A1T5B5K6_9SPHI|nr:3-deoxy-manno-octulosonate cytidylyltransferase [Daejeonella lutea]SKB42506.1 3-deoxy-manno-octulosonate cytidylyltransferase (CMP-KDO synthetase) [Daejeonella lutea]
MKILGIIPARFASTRFPGKPLIDVAGKSMIQRVYVQCLKSTQLDKVVVATDDKRIHDHVLNFGGEAVMTSEKHSSGTDRCNEVAGMFPDFDICINIQGDEPMIDPEQIDLVSGCFKDAAVGLATLVKKVIATDELFNPNTPKVIFNKNMEAVYFSRNTIPFLRNSKQENWLNDHTYYKHIGIYGYRTTILSEITQLEMSGLEKAESLEQLRWVENGYKIKVAITEKESQAIDTPEDLQKVLALLSPDT